MVRKEPYLAAYSMTDPRTVERLPGRARGGYAKFADILKRTLAAEPHATRERGSPTGTSSSNATYRSPTPPRSLNGEHPAGNRAVTAR